MADLSSEAVTPESERHFPGAENPMSMSVRSQGESRHGSIILMDQPMRADK